MRHQPGLYSILFFRIGKSSVIFPKSPTQLNSCFYVRLHIALAGMRGSAQNWEKDFLKLPSRRPICLKHWLRHTTARQSKLGSTRLWVGRISLTIYILVPRLVFFISTFAGSWDLLAAATYSKADRSVIWLRSSKNQTFERFCTKAIELAMWTNAGLHHERKILLCFKRVTRFFYRPWELGKLKLNYSNFSIYGPELEYYGLFVEGSIRL